MFKYIIVVTLFLNLYMSSPLQASDFHSPRTEALGGAGHASPLLNDAIYLNPSFTSFNQVHSLSFNYLTYGDSTITTPAGTSDYYGHNINASVLDGTQESIFQAGVGYTRRDDSSLLHLGASKNITQKMGVGIGSKFIFPNDPAASRIYEASLSVSGILSTWFQTALVVDNLLETASSRGFYREFTLGTKFNLSSIILIYIDPLWVPNLPVDQSTNQATWGFESGVEFPFFSEVFLRVGTFKNATVPYQAQRGNGYGLGLGWMGPKLSFDYSFSRVITPISTLSHNFGMSVFF